MSQSHSIQEAPLDGQSEKPKRNVVRSMLRGARGVCPNCGEGRLFYRYLKVNEQCPNCAEALHHQRADDAPPYFTIFIAGHLLVPALLAFERALTPPLWLHAAIWLPVTVALCMAMLPLVKGAIVNLQWALYMHGFDPDSSDNKTHLGAETVG